MAGVIGVVLGLAILATIAMLLLMRGRREPAIPGPGPLEPNPVMAEQPLHGPADPTLEHGGYGGTPKA